MSIADSIRTAKNYTVAAKIIREQITTNDKWLIRGIIAIYNHQTEDEQTVGVTKYNNKIGFSGLDASIMTSLAKRIEDWEKTPVENREYPTPLSYGQIKLARRLMPKYSGQLAKIARPRNKMKHTL